MICETCKKQIQLSGNERPTSIHGYCPDCGEIATFWGVLSGYWLGVFSTSIPIYFFLLASTGGSNFIIACTMGPLATYLLLRWFILKQGTTYYQSKRQLQKDRYAKVFLGILLGIASILFWFYIGLSITEDSIRP